MEEKSGKGREGVAFRNHYLFIYLFAKNNGIRDEIQLNVAILFLNCNNPVGILCHKCFFGFLRKLDANTDFLHDTRCITDILEY